MSSMTSALCLAGLAGMAAGGGVLHRAPPLTPPTPSAEDVLKRTRELYPTLRSYADSGSVTAEVTGFRDRARFRTYFVNEPRNFLIDYQEIASEYENGTRLPLEGRIVIWMRHGLLQSWNASLGTLEEFPEGSDQITPFIQAGAASKGAALLIPSLIYVKARLVTTIQELAEVTSAGFEDIRGRRCHKLMGVARSVYPSGQVTNVRNATIWIDAETYLIRQVFTDTPKGYPRGQISRLTITYEPRLNPVLHDSLFAFKVPGEGPK